jgi:cell division protein FtsL
MELWIRRIKDQREPTSVGIWQLPQEKNADCSNVQEKVLYNALCVATLVTAVKSVRNRTGNYVTKENVLTYVT